MPIQTASTIFISIGIYKTLSLVGVLVVGTWYASSRFAKVETKIEGFDTRLTGLEGRFDKAFTGRSPIALLEKGQQALEKSGFKKWIDDRKDSLLAKYRLKYSTNNEYDIQESAFLFFDQLDFGDFENTLKETAFLYGMNVETVKRIGGIYFRDICFSSFL